ncbi:3' terminal RNA ribose 2'-O-methyltransferase Hen1 [Embleya sp. NBC_00896]|uniref:3' terminal RNA ribose 2'-O-methyltransferase Hen1 n=1 Tax=Embleya sp. NBC_00896 TaxID=2975961 RepID=UPI003870062E|nr:3' terminal RNA ribose 2'-O-methyltransferase Hen1 [Embleya sp. NBC_00896]
MFLTIATTHQPATDLGFLLHKHPGKAQRFSTTYGEAHVFYPDADDARCTAALLLDVDPIALTRGVKRGKGAKGSPDLALAQYVNDRPYAASSLLAVALGTVFRTAMQGRCDARPELPGTPLPLEIEVPALPARGGEEMVRRLFEPLGWQVGVDQVSLDPRFPGWGESRYVRLSLAGTMPLADALRHLYVLLPVLDNAKHYWVAPDEVDKLLRAGEGWLAAHPDRELIASRYLSRRHTLTRSAIERLAEIDETAPENLDNAVPDEPEADTDADAAPQTPADAAPEQAESGSETPVEPGPAADDPRPVSLAAHRRDAILAALRAAGAERVLDLGCGDGKLIGALLKEPRFREIVGVDASTRALTIAERKLKLARMSERQRDRVRLIQGALTYTDKRLAGYDAAVLCEVIEHLDEPRLPALEYAVLGAARPATVVVTTPNVEYNVRYAPEEPGGEGLAAGAMRHGDHRFEWDRATFRAWAERAAAKYGYATRFESVGEVDPEVGPSTQMVVLTRTETGDVPATGDAPVPDPTSTPTPTPNDEGTGATA